MTKTRCRACAGNSEPAKCTELVWADPLRLPADTIGYVAAALQAVRAGRRLETFGWEP